MHGLCNQLAHLFEFSRGGWTIIFADDVVAQTACAHEHAQVDSRPSAREVAEVFVKRMPIQLDVILLCFSTKFFEHTVIRGRNRRSLTCDFCGDSLGDLARSAPVHQNIELRLALYVDKSR